MQEIGVEGAQVPTRSVTESVSKRSVAAQVARIVNETADAKTVVFAIPPDRAADFTYRPGQFLTLRISSDRTGSVARCYSLSSCPGIDDRLAVTIKRTVNGYGSNWLCDHLSEGDTVELLPPAGVFTPQSADEDLLLWGAGSGITPLFSILRWVLSTGDGRVTLVYANRDTDSVIFANALRSLAAEYPRRLTVIHWLESLQEVPSVDHLAQLAAPFTDRRSFVCGPAGFMGAVRGALAGLGVDPARVHAEVFTSLSGDPFDESSEITVDEQDCATAEVEADGSTHTVLWPRSATLVDAMLAHGIDVPYSCREGQCGTCACVVVDGEVTMDDTGVLDDDDLDAGYALACQARPVGDVLRVRF